MRRPSFAVVAVVVAAVFAVGCAHEPSPLPTMREAKALSAAEAGEIVREAARRGEDELIAGLLDAGAVVDARDRRGFTPLILAAYHDQLTTTQLLLSRGADACAKDNGGNTALMGAAFKGNDDVVRRLLEEPCAVDEANGAGRTALMFAALVGRSDVVKLLQERGADQTVTDVDGKTAADWAATQGTSLP